MTAAGGFPSESHTRMRTRSSGAAEVSIVRQVTAVLAETAHQRSMCPEHRDLEVLGALVDELTSTPRDAIIELAGAAVSFLERLAGLEGRDVTVVLREMAPL